MKRHLQSTLKIIAIVLTALLLVPSPSSSGEKEKNRYNKKSGLIEGEVLPTGMKITPAAVRGSIFQALNPGLPTHPDFVAGQAVSTATSPDGNTLLILTSGYNRNYDQSGEQYQQSLRNMYLSMIFLKIHRERRRYCRFPIPLTG